MFPAFLTKALQFLLGILLAILPYLAPPALHSPSGIETTQALAPLNETASSVSNLTVLPPPPPVLPPVAPKANDSFAIQNRSADPPSAPTAPPPAQDPSPSPPPPPVLTPVTFFSSATISSVDVLPGDLATLTLSVKDIGADPVTVGLSLARASPGWSATLALDAVQLAPNETKDVNVVLIAPADAEAGSSGTATVSLHSDAPVDETRTAVFSAHVVSRPPVYGVAVGVDSASRYVKPDGKTNYTFTVLNTGTVSDTFLLSVPVAKNGWSASLSTHEVTLAPGESHRVAMDVTPPITAIDGDVAYVNMTAASETHAQTNATAHTATTMTFTKAGIPAPIPTECIPVPDTGGLAQPICVDAAQIWTSIVGGT